VISFHIKVPSRLEFLFYFYGETLSKITNQQLHSFGIME